VSQYESVKEGVETAQPFLRIVSGGGGDDEQPAAQFRAFLAR
jgi:hypothetical protein